MTHRSVVLTLANHKGGCSKTTSVANLAAAFAERGLRVLAIDADPQANLSEAFGYSGRSRGSLLEHCLEAAVSLADATAYELAGSVDVVPCSVHLQRVVMLHAGDPDFPFRLRGLVDRARDEYNIILVDTPPGLGPLSSMAMLASDWVIVPARPADLDVTGAMKVGHLINTELVDYNPGLRLLGVLITQSDRRWHLTADARAALDRAGIRRLRVEIPARVRVGAAPRYGAPTFVLQPDGAVAHAYRELAADLMPVLRVE